VAQHVAEWADLLECEVYPVMEDAEAATAANKVLGKSKDEPAASRVRAAACVLDHAADAFELEDLDVRIERLEQIGAKKL
jgi:hypothetical protein